MGGFPGGGLYSSSYVRAPRAPLAAVAILVPIELLSMLETRCVHLQNSVQQYSYRHSCRTPRFVSNV